jgi:hypothetical protein
MLPRPTSDLVVWSCDTTETTITFTAVDPVPDPLNENVLRFTVKTPDTGGAFQLTVDQSYAKTETATPTETPSESANAPSGDATTPPASELRSQTAGRSAGPIRMAGGPSRS